MCIGLAVFGVAYLFVIVAIFYDLRYKISEYNEFIEDDLGRLRRMNYNIDDPDFKKALQNRLDGVKEEEGADDQLIEEAKKLE